MELIGQYWYENTQRHEREKKLREEQERIAREIKERKDKELRDFKSVLKESNRWHKATNLRHFIDAIEQKTDASPEWLAWARKKADWYDPFIKADDELLQNVNKNSLKFVKQPGKEEEEEDDWLIRILISLSLILGLTFWILSIRARKITLMIEMVIEARNAAISELLTVKRILPFRLRRMVGPFIFMDHAGPIENIPANHKSLDVLPHPHIGLSTITYLFGGKVTHRDSLGVEQIIRPGEVNWMTAGSGIAHSERFEDPSVLAGGGLEMIQTWVALPEKDEESSPAFDNYKPEQLPIYSDKGIWMRLIAGNAYGLTNEVSIHSPLCYLHVVLQAAAKFGLPKEHSERGFYIAKGSVEVSGQIYRAGQMLVFAEGAGPVINAEEQATLMLLGGEPLGKRHIWWNFVSSRKERIQQAKEDWKQGRIKLPPKDNKEFIPLPEHTSSRSEAPKPEPLS